MPKGSEEKMQAKSRFILSLCAAILVFGFSFTVFADTIRLKDGTVVKGKVVGFKDQQFTVLIGDGARGRRSQLQVFIEDVESIEFDNAADSAIADVNNNRVTAQPPQTTPERTNPPISNNQKTNPNVTTTSTLPPSADKPATNSGGLSQVINSAPISSPKTGDSGSQPVISTPKTNTTNSGSSGKFITVRGESNPLKVLADATANGWTNSGVVVRKGQRVRISANGRVSLGQGRFATPAGVGSIADSQRLMQTEPTGALIAVIGDDNNDFVFIGSSREFVAQRDGMLFLGINEGNLDDNSGAFDVTIEAEAVNNTAKK
jgi:hypothetical protein